MAAADVTSTINVGCRVFGTDYRHPVVLAKELASLDILSDGRLEVGLGCGWMADEYQAMGIPFDRPGVRIDRMEETLAVIRACFGDGEVDVDGAHFQVTGFEGVPKPVRPGGPPIMIGGGARRVLGLAGREADIVSVNLDNRAGRLGPEGTTSGSGAHTARKIEWIKAGAGDRFDQIELEIGAYFTVVTDDRRGAIEGIAGRFGADPAVFADHAHTLIGSVDGICEQLESPARDLRLLLHHRRHPGGGGVRAGGRAPARDLTPAAENRRQRGHVLSLRAVAGAQRDLRAPRKGISGARPSKACRGPREARGAAPAPARR